MLLGKIIHQIMVPLIGTIKELKQQKDVIQYAAKEVFAEYGIKVEFEIGTMIEIPCLFSCFGLQR